MLPSSHIRNRMTSIRSCSSLYEYSQAILSCSERVPALDGATAPPHAQLQQCLICPMLDCSLCSASTRLAVCSQDQICLGLTCFNAVRCRPMAQQRWRLFRSEEKWRGSFGGCPGILHLCLAAIGQVSARATFQASSRTFVLPRSPHHAIRCPTHPLTPTVSPGTSPRYHHHHRTARRHRRTKPLGFDPTSHYARRKPGTLDAMAMLDSNYSRSSSNYHRKASVESSRRSNTQASAYAVNASTMALTGFHFSTPSGEGAGW